MLLVQILEVHLLLLVLFVLFFLISNDVGDRATRISEEQHAHYHQDATHYSFTCIRSTDVTVTNSRHCCNCEVKRGSVQLDSRIFRVLARDDPVRSCLIIGVA